MKTKYQNVINKMTLDNFDEPYLDVLMEQQMETKPSRTIRNHNSFAHHNKRKYEKPRNPKYFEDYDD